MELAAIEPPNARRKHRSDALVAENDAGPRPPADHRHVAAVLCFDYGSIICVTDHELHRVGEKDAVDVRLQQVKCTAVLVGERALWALVWRMRMGPSGTRQTDENE